MWASPPLPSLTPAAEGMAPAASLGTAPRAVSGAASSRRWRGAHLSPSRIPVSLPP